MKFTLAIIPIILILFFMVRMRWSAARAGGIGYLSSLFIAVVFFGVGPQVLAYAHTRALLLSVDVLLIIWAAFLLYRVADEAGAIRTIGNALPHLTADKGMQAILIGWVFASFLQGVGGFGVPVAVVAPILVGLGFSPLASVVISSVGHSWGVTFGSLGSSFQALMAATGLSASILAPDSALFLGIICVVVGFMVVHAASGWSTVGRLWIPVVLIGVTMGSIQYLAAVLGFWNIAALAGSLAGLVIVLPIARRYQGEKADNGQLNWNDFIIALSGYVVLVMIILIVQLSEPLKLFLSRIVIKVNFPEVSTSFGYITPAGPGRTIVLFEHTGMLLVYASVVAFFIYKIAGKYKPGEVKRIVDGTVRRVLSSSISIVSMVTMAVIMDNAGMTVTLAQGIADGMGKLFPIAAPWIGALGAFMTGSNTNSNMVFGGLQLRTAELLGYSVGVILAAQTAAAALASVIAPTKIVVGASTVGMGGKEGAIMGKLLGYIGVLVLLISALTVIVIWLQ